MKIKDIDEIEKYIDNEMPLPYAKFSGWMSSNDIEVLGAIFYIFDQRNHLILQYPSVEKVMSFYITYFSRCLIENPKGDWADNRYVAAGNLMRLYKALRKDSSISRTQMKDLRLMIKDIYKRGDSDTKKAIVNGLLEHLFEDREIQKEFEDWKMDHNLKSAYFDALSWTK